MNYEYYTENGAAAFYAGGVKSFDAWCTLTGDDSVFAEHTFPDPTRSIETYMQHLGQTATIDAFIAKIRAQDRFNWDTDYTAEVVNDWLRAGFWESETATAARLVMVLT